MQLRPGGAALLDSNAWARVPFAALLVSVLAAYYVNSSGLSDLSLWWDVTFLAVAVIPGLFLLTFFGLPLIRLNGTVLGATAVALGAITAALELADFEIAANFAKFAAVTFAGWWFLRFFESVTWVLLVALLIVPVDIFSVARGPTKEILENQPRVFDSLSVFFPIPGELPLAQLGLPDVLFFALFLGTADRFGLRVGWTFTAMALSFGATLAIAVAWSKGGFPALPLLSLAFVAANGDLLWRAYRRRREHRRSTEDWARNL